MNSLKVRRTGESKAAFCEEKFLCAPSFHARLTSIRAFLVFYREPFNFLRGIGLGFMGHMFNVDRRKIYDTETEKKKGIEK